MSKIAAVMLIICFALGWNIIAEADISDKPMSMSLDCLTTPEPGETFSIDKDMGVIIDERWYPIMSCFDELKTALGEPQDVLLMECDAHPDYYDKEFIYDFGSVFTHPVNGVDMWYEIVVKKAPININTSRNIGVGSTLNDMLIAYGEDYLAEDNTVYIYSLSGSEKDYATPFISVEIDRNTIIGFKLHYPVFEQ